MSFDGWPPAALEFYAGLEADNSRAYFERERETYEGCVREPLEDLLQEAQGEFGPGKVFRPNRDVRFSNDKSPYKTQAAAVVPSRGGAASYYLSLSKGGVHVGGGVYELSRDQRDRYRAAVQRDRPANELTAIVEQLERQGLEFAGPELKRAPKGIDPDHPRIGLLRRTRLAALRAFPPGPDIHEGERAREAVFGTWRALTPLIGWIDEHVGAPEQPVGAAEQIRRRR
jgi:uncharacterized protein (TIGR02453 family)